ncbi:hypothetical protein NH340_JMT01913 [Sarcoptes scabiei]|nr:hypothetical protein NH340_JMT01913 [Sarcoptes scabiei]
MPEVGVLEPQDEVRIYTNWLFAELTREQFIQSGIDEATINENEELSFLNVEVNSKLMKRIAKDLQVISDDFAKSSERFRVLEKAQQVNFDNVNYEDFRGFLNELFRDGITREKIVVLFYFCSDVVVRAYSSPFKELRRLFEWFLTYIIDRIGTWVLNHGGWSIVLGTYMVPAFTQSIFYWLGSAALVMFMYKKLFNFQ